MPPLELALTRPPPTTSLQDQPRAEELDPTTQKQEFLERLKTLRIRADGKLTTAQARYCRVYDRGVSGQKNARVREGDQVYVRVEVNEAGRSHKLDSLVHGPYRVVENAGHTLRLQVGPDVVRVSSDRVTPAPPISRNAAVEDETTPTVDPAPVAAPDRVVDKGERTPKKRVQWVPGMADQARSREEYVVEKIVDEAQNADGGKLYRVRWMGYKPEEDTWEKEAHLPLHFIRRYERGLSRERRGDVRVPELMHRGLGTHF
jgi:Chromo (CHRromatin Organisation MOdifier) domain